MNDNSSTISRYNLTFTADRIRELRVGVTKIEIDHHWDPGIDIFRKNDVANQNAPLELLSPDEKMAAVSMPARDAQTFQELNHSYRLQYTK